MDTLPMQTTAQPMKIAVLGGTGAEGGGLAFRLAAAGHQVIIGSRDAAKAAAAAAELAGQVRREIAGADNRAASAGADVVILTVPYPAQKATVEDVRDALKGKILIDATVPLVPPRVSRVQLPAGCSAVAAIQELLGKEVRVVSAFQNVSARHLKELDHPIDCDVLICGNDTAACELVIGLATDIGLRGLYAGPICNSAAAEALTSALITINRHYKIPAAGVRITGLPPNAY
jgi:NADPH-dependent F420 reductase